MSVPPIDVASPPPPPTTGAPSAEEKQWALFAHLSGLAGALVTGVWFGWGCFLGPLIIWLLKRETMPFVNDQAKEALNFNITFAIVGVVLFLVTVMTFFVGIIVTFPLGVICALGWLVFTVIAAIKASEGVAYRYPISLRLIK